MIITQFKLTNFGQHKSLSFETDSAPIVGIIGASGKGKTTILKAIDYLFTGKLPNKANDWIRYGAKSAELELEFNKGGKLGKLVRRITPTTASRSLMWDGVDYTKAKDVDYILASLFGSDKEAISNAVFIDQGELHRILFGSDVERCELFIKLINLSFCEKHARTIDRQIKLLSENTEDVSLLVDERREVVTQLEEQLTNVKLEYSKNYGNKEKLDTYTAIKQSRGNAIQVQNTFKLKKAELTNKFNIRQNLSEESLLNLEEQYKTLVNNYETKKERLNRLSTDLIKLSNLNRNKATIQDIQKELQEINSEKLRLSTLYGSDANIKTQVTELNTKLTTIEKIEDLNINVVNYTKRILDIQTQLNPLEINQPIKINELSSLTTQKDVLFSDLQLLTKWFTTQQTLKEKGICDCENKCVNCGLTLDKSVVISDETLTELNDSITTKNNLYTELNSRWYELNTEVKNLNDDIVRLTSELSRLTTNKQATEEQLKLLTSEVDISSKEELLVTKSNLTTYIDSLSTLKGSSDSLIKQLVTHTEVVTNETTVFEFDSEASYTVELNKLREELNEINSSDNLTKLNKLINEVKTADSEIIFVTKLINELSEKYESLKAVSLSKDISDEELDKVVVELELKYKEELETKGTINQLEKQVTLAIDNLKDVEQRLARQKDTMELIGHLERLKNLFQRNGLPMKCINDYFAQLVELTQASLETMDVDFVVSVDDSKPVSFLFQKMADETKTLQNQNRMSGGEKVRLSVAFLIAVQQLLLPDFGFLVLDEPSQHLDNNAKNNMADLLIQMSGILQNSANQIFISDHSEELLRAYNKTIEL